MSKYIRNTENLDPQRGDKMTLHRAKMMPLYATSFPRETRRDILDLAFGWFCDERDNPIPHLKDPLADAFAQSFINEQIEAVGKYIEKCDQDSKNRKSKDRGNDGQPPSTEVNQGEQYNNFDNDNGNTKPLSLSGGIGKRGGQKPPVCNPLSVDDAKKIIKQYVPANIGSLYGMMLAPNQPTKLCSGLVRDIQDELWEQFVYDISSDLHPDSSDDEDECEKIGTQFDKPLIALFQQLENPKRWMLALAKAYADTNDPAMKPNGKPIRNPDSFIMARMKKVTQALKTLDALDGKAKPNALLPTEY